MAFIAITDMLIKEKKKRADLRADTWAICTVDKCAANLASALNLMAPPSVRLKK